jgi:hypothetical protein
MQRLPESNGNLVDWLGKDTAVDVPPVRRKT